MQLLRHYLLAVQFFTRIPITGRLAQWVGFSPAMQRASVVHLPGVGCLVGGAAGVVMALLLWALNALHTANPFSGLVAAVLATVTSVWLTGGFHEDGLADVVDGLGGSTEPERALAIMKDSRLGAYGALALALVLLTKISLLAWLAWQLGLLAAAVLALGHVVSRLWPLCLVRALPYVGHAQLSKSRALAAQLPRHGLWAAALWCAVPLALFAGLGPCLVAPTAATSATVATAATAATAIAPMTPLALATMAFAGLACSALATWRLARWFARRLAGITGDCLGAAQQVSEVAFYLGCTLVAARLAA